MAQVVSTDPDGDALSYKREIMPESKDLGDGGDFESTPESIPDFEGEPNQLLKFI